MCWPATYQSSLANLSLTRGLSLTYTILTSYTVWADPPPLLQEPPWVGYVPARRRERSHLGEESLPP